MQGQPNHRSDFELVEAARTGSDAAMEQLVERYFRIVYSIAYARLRHREAAEDLVQEVFLTAHLNLPTLKDPHLFGPWITRIARNASHEWLDRGMRRSKLVAMVPLDEKAERLLAQKAGQEQMEEKERSEAVQAAIFRLPIEQRELVLMRYIEGLSASVIAERTGVHAKTIRRHLAKAVSQLKASVEALFSDAAPAIRAPRSTSVRTFAILASAGALSTATKSTLATATAAVVQESLAALSASPSISAATKVFGFLKTTSITGNLVTESATGGLIMTLKAKIIASCLIVMLFGAGAYHYQMQRQAGADGEVSEASSAEFSSGSASVTLRHGSGASSTASTRTMGTKETELILAAKTNAEACKSAKVSYSIKSKTFALSPAMKQLATGVYDLEKNIEWLFEGDKFRLTIATRSKPWGHRNKLKDMVETFAWDGQTFYTYRDTENYGIIDKNYVEFGALQDRLFQHLHYLHGRPMHEELEEIFALKALKHLEYSLNDRFRYKGRTVWRLEIRRNGDMEVLLFDPAADLNMIRHEQMSIGDLLEVQKFAQEKGVFFPKMIVKEVFFEQNGKRTLSCRVISRLKQLEAVNEPMPPSSFEIKYPKTAKVVRSKDVSTR